MKLLGDALGLFLGALALVVLGVLLVPFAIPWCALLLLVDACTVRRGHDAAPAAGRRPIEGASIMILNWDGRALLERLLPSLRRAVAHDGGDHEIIVIDNGSVDDSVAFVEREFPEVRILRHPENRKFVRGYNDAFHAATKDIVVLLNNDMVVDEDFLGPLLRGFADPATFAVSSQIFLEDEEARRVETGLTGGWLHRGVLKLRHDPVPEHIAGLIPVLWAGGGSAAFDREKLLAIGGFDTLYDPFYFEDTGLSFEAWKRGWHVLLAPDSRVVHAHQASSGRLSPSYIARIKRRNQHLFCWRHLTSPGHTIATALLLPVNVPRLALIHRGSSLLHRATIEAAGLLAVLPRIPALLAARFRNARQAVRTDEQVLSLAHSRHRFEISRADYRPGQPRRRILMLTARVPKQGVDGSWGLFELIKTLGPRHDITLFTLMDHEDDARHIEALKPYVQRLDAHRIGRDIGALDLHHRIPLRLRGSYTAPMLRRHIDTLLRTEPFDLLQADYIEMAAMTGDLVGGVRAIHVVHEPLFLAIQRQRISALVPRLIRWARHAQAVNYEARLYPKFQRIVCLTPEDEQQLERWAPALRTAVNPMGADLDRIAPCAPSTGHTMLSVSYFGHPPNVDATIWFVRHVLPLVRAEIPDASIRLVGGGATAVVTALADHEGVELLGYVEDLGPEMERAAVCIAPLREGGGLRTKVIESFAYGRTMVVTPLATAGIQAIDGEHFRVGETAAEFAAALVALLRDDDERHAMESAARALAFELYTNDKMAERQEAIFDAVLGEVPR